MKQLLFKRVDLWLQIVVAVIPVILWKHQGIAIACSYLVVMQLLSAAVNTLFLKKRFIGSGRKIYLVIVITVVLACLFTWFSGHEELLYGCIVFTMMLVLPVLVPVYFVVSFFELMNIRRAKKFDKIDHYKNALP